MIPYKPKVLLYNLTCPIMNEGEQKTIKINGKPLMESGLANSLPILSLTVSNQSFTDIKVILNQADDSSFTVPSGGYMPFSGYPITDIAIRDIGTTNIAEGEVNLTLCNDMAECLRFYACKEKGIVPYV